jgi:hypothetical protein
MARAHFVKKARKAIRDAGIKKGDSYYWWKFRFGGKRVSKTPPKPSQLTQSDFWSAVYSAQESAGTVPSFADLKDACDNLVSDLQDIESATQDKFDNMPEGLQQGDTGQMLEERVAAIQDVISELEGIDCEPELDESEGAPIEGETEDEKTERIGKYREEKAQEIWDEVTTALDGISCS